MTPDDIIEMAKKSCDSDKVDAWHNGFWTLTQEELERFAALVAAAEREKVAAWMMGRGYATGHGDTIEDLLTELDWQIAENWTRGMVNGVHAEREVIAQSLDKQADLAVDEIDRQWAQEMAAAVRARGQA